MKRIVNPLGKTTIGSDHIRTVRVLHRDLDQVKALVLQQANLIQGRLDQGLRDRRPVLFKQILVEGTGVDTDPNWNGTVLGLPGDCPDVVWFADVAGVQAKIGSGGRR
jgi:hypothetical protein